MKLIIKSITWLLIFTYSCSYGQIEQYTYKCELKGISNQWHKITLPDEIFGNVSRNLYDIRIFGITANNDTIEAPYLLHLTKEKISSSDINFKTVNTSYNEKGYFFTFEIPSNVSINQIKLDFKQKNFDWLLKLEGSQNQQEWFTVLEDYRILSIENELTGFQFTKISFPDSKYHFFRILIRSKEKPDLTDVKVSQFDVTNGTFRNYPVKKVNIYKNKQARETVLDIDLQSLVPVSHIKIGIKDTFDYYRSFTIKYLTDSIKTEQGWKYSYNSLTSGTLNSFDVNEFECNSSILQKIKIQIHNQDNQPLTIDTIEVKGYVHELVARFTEPASYFMTYGNIKAGRPKYDIDRFKDQIPDILIPLELGDEQKIVKEELPVTDPLFKNKAWLWIIMTVIVLLLGWFSLKMIRKE